MLHPHHTKSDCYFNNYYQDDDIISNNNMDHHTTDSQVFKLYVSYPLYNQRWNRPKMAAGQKHVVSFMSGFTSGHSVQHSVHDSRITSKTFRLLL